MVKRFKDLLKRGIDLSVFNFDSGHKPTRDELQGMIPFGVIFVAIRVGYGRVIDGLFKTLWKIFRGLGIKRLPYWYLDYYSHKKLEIKAADWGREQAENAWELLEKDPGEGPLALDMEESSFGWRVASFAQKYEYNQIARAFLERWSELAGREAILYCSIGWLDKLFNWMKDFDLWIAWYNHFVGKEQILTAMAKRKWRGTALIHQYASDGDTDGDGLGNGKDAGLDSSTVDLNEWIGSEAQWNEFWGKSPVTAEDSVLDEEVLYLLDIKIPNLTVRTGPGRKYQALRNAGKGIQLVYEVDHLTGEPYPFARINKGEQEWVSLDPRYSEKIAR